MLQSRGRKVKGQYYFLPTLVHQTRNEAVCIYLTLQMSDIYLPLTVGATVYFAQPDALNVSSSPMHTPVSWYTTCVVITGISKTRNGMEQNERKEQNIAT